ncbi:MAG: cytochrome c [Candidatus Kapabacteria bacterium]|nr:cytochrome c [Candidatus Kapabacteria bacterium]
MVTLTISFAIAFAGADKATMERGAKVYKGYCSTCHQANGQGLSTIYPPLANSDWLKNNPKEKVIEAVVYGMKGPITVNGKKYNGVMNPLPSTYKDEDVAAVITYVYNSWGNPGTVVTVEDVRKVKAARSKKK